MESISRAVNAGIAIAKAVVAAFFFFPAPRNDREFIVPCLDGYDDFALM